MIAEDEPIACMDLSENLKDLGCDVVGTAADGFDAVELCREHRPDVVLMDVNMPVFDGLSAAETIIEEDLAGCVVLYLIILKVTKCWNKPTYTLKKGA